MVVGMRQTVSQRLHDRRPGSSLPPLFLLTALHDMNPRYWHVSRPVMAMLYCPGDRAWLPAQGNNVTGEVSGGGGGGRGATWRGGGGQWPLAPHDAMLCALPAFTHLQHSS